MSLTAARIRALNSVIEDGSYSAAARRLGMSQPAVSQAIQDLERAFKVKLFTRRGQRLVPTELCLELAPIVSEIRRLEDKAHLVLQRGENLQSGVLRVGLGNTMPGMALIGGFRQHFPKIQVLVELGNYADIIEAVLAQRVDCGVLPNVPEDGRFRAKVCVTQDVVAIVPPQHPLATVRQVRIAELTDHPLIFRSKGSSTQKVVDHAFRQAGLQPRPSLILETRDGVCEAVANGLGVGFMWRHATSRSDGLRRLPIREMQTAYKEVAFRRKDASNPIVEMFFATMDSVKIA